MLRRISPVCKILMNSLGFSWSCTCASFSFTKNVSGVQICKWFFASTSLSSPGFFSKDNRGSCQNCRKYIVISKSCGGKYCKQKDHYNNSHTLVYTFNLWRLINLTREGIFHKCFTIFSSDNERIDSMYTDIPTTTAGPKNDTFAWKMVEK